MATSCWLSPDEEAVVAAFDLLASGQDLSHFNLNSNTTCCLETSWCPVVQIQGRCNQLPDSALYSDLCNPLLSSSYSTYGETSSLDASENMAGICFPLSPVVEAAALPSGAGCPAAGGGYLPVGGDIAGATIFRTPMMAPLVQCWQLGSPCKTAVLPRGNYTSELHAIPGEIAMAQPRFQSSTTPVPAPSLPNVGFFDGSTLTASYAGVPAVSSPIDNEDDCVQYHAEQLLIKMKAKLNDGQITPAAASLAQPPPIWSSSYIAANQALMSELSAIPGDMIAMSDYLKPPSFQIFQPCTATERPKGGHYCTLRSPTDPYAAHADLPYSGHDVAAVHWRAREEFLAFMVDSKQLDNVPTQQHHQQQADGYNSTISRPEPFYGCHKALPSLEEECPSDGEPTDYMEEDDDIPSPWEGSQPIFSCSNAGEQLLTGLHLQWEPLDAMISTSKYSSREISRKAPKETPVAPEKNPYCSLVQLQYRGDVVGKSSSCLSCPASAPARISADAALSMFSGCWQRQVAIHEGGTGVHGATSTASSGSLGWCAKAKQPDLIISSIGGTNAHPVQAARQSFCRSSWNYISANPVLSLVKAQNSRAPTVAHGSVMSHLKSTDFNLPHRLSSTELFRHNATAKGLRARSSSLFASETPSRIDPTATTCTDSSVYSTLGAARSLVLKQQPYPAAAPGVCPGGTASSTACRTNHSAAQVTRIAAERRCRIRAAMERLRGVVPGAKSAGVDTAGALRAAAQYMRFLHAQITCLQNERNIQSDEEKAGLDGATSRANPAKHGGSSDGTRALLQHLLMSVRIQEALSREGACLVTTHQARILNYDNTASYNTETQRENDNYLPTAI